MGNYKSRPKVAFSDELHQKLRKGYDIMISRLDQLCTDQVEEIENLTNEQVKLLRALRSENFMYIDERLSSDKSSANFSWSGASFLHLAVLCNSPKVVEKLLTSSVDVDCVDWAGFTPIHLAAYFGFANIATCLTEHDANPNCSSLAGESPLHLAALNGHLAVARELLRKRANIFQRDKEENNVLHFCAKSGNDVLLSTLLQLGAVLAHEQNVFGETPLHIACYMGRLDFVKIIVGKCGYDSLVKENIYSETPLHCACTGGRSVQVVSFLLDQPGVNINFQGSDGHTALHSACFHGHAQLVQYLLNQSADPDLNAHSYVSNANHESSNSFLRDVEHFDETGTKILTPDVQTPIMWAYENGYDNIVSILKQHKAHQSSKSCDYRFIPLPSPLGKLRSITREKAEVLQLKSLLESRHQVDLSEVNFQEAVGSGSFGRVYKGVYKGSTVAIKRYRPMAYGSRSDTEMFCREVSILSRLYHPNILKFIGASLMDPSQFALVTEFAGGGSLFTLLHEHKINLSLMRKLSIGLDVAKAMEYLHTLPSPIIHRDLNSHNILLTEDGKAVVADFGESRFFATSVADMTKQPGNLRWMAPEVFLQCTQYTTKADVFSYALCLWEINVGEVPFSHLKPAAAALEMACKGSRPLLSRCSPEALQWLIDKCWAENAAERPAFNEICEKISRIHVVISAEGAALSSEGEFLAPSSCPAPVLQAYNEADGATIYLPTISEDMLKMVDKNGYVIDAFQSDLCIVDRCIVGPGSLGAERD